LAIIGLVLTCFFPKIKEREIWNNVLIICKQSRNPEDDAQGALAAAKLFNPSAKIPVLGYTFLDDPTLTWRQRKRFEGKHTQWPKKCSNRLGGVMPQAISYPISFSALS
jgi:hypothetical protein